RRRRPGARVAPDRSTMAALLAVSVLLLTACQQASPAPAGQRPSPLQRYVDFSPDLERGNVSVHIGRLEQLQEDRRNPIADGRPGAPGFETGATGTMREHEVLLGIEPVLVTLR